MDFTEAVKGKKIVKIEKDFYGYIGSAPAYAIQLENREYLVMLNDDVHDKDDVSIHFSQTEGKNLNHFNGAQIISAIKYVDSDGYYEFDGDDAYHVSGTTTIELCTDKGTLTIEFYCDYWSFDDCANEVNLYLVPRHKLKKFHVVIEDFSGFELHRFGEKNNFFLG